MSQYWPLLLLIPMIVVAQVFVFAAIMRTRSHARRAIQAAKERGADQFSQTGGGQLGWLYASIPFASIIVSPDEIVFALAGKRVNLPRASVHTIVRYRSIFSNGVQFEHAGVKGASPAIFWSANPTGLLDALERMDWPVDR